MRYEIPRCGSIRQCAATSYVFVTEDGKIAKWTKPEKWPKFISIDESVKYVVRIYTSNKGNPQVRIVDVRTNDVIDDAWGWDATLELARKYKWLWQILLEEYPYLEADDNG